jgi:hypothetical protein
MRVRAVWHVAGENNVGSFHGNAQAKLGYGCLMPTLVREWREAWSATAGTTDPLAPFGLVTLSQGDDESAAGMGSFRWSQTANMGSLPNQELPRTFLAHGYDLGDPYQADKCPRADARYNCSQQGYMGPALHPRLKYPVGHRLAVGAMAIAYNSSLHYGQPTLSGCVLSNVLASGSANGPAALLTLKFSATELGGANLTVNPYNAADPSRSALSVLVAKSRPAARGVLVELSLERSVTSHAAERTTSERSTAENAANHATFADRFVESWMAAPAESRVVLSTPLDDPTGTWVPVHIKLGSDGRDGAPTVVADLTPLAGATPLAVRYAWDGADGPATGDVVCCDPAAVAQGSSDECVPASCPIMTADARAIYGGLPANPFLAKLVDGKCECPPPQSCGE